MNIYELTSEEKALSSQTVISDGLADLQWPCWCIIVVHQHKIVLVANIE